MVPDKELFLRNIYTLAKEKGVRIGDLETSCGVSVGYLARFRQDKNQDLPGMDFVIRAAAVLNTSLDFLLYFDYNLLEIYLWKNHHGHVLHLSNQTLLLYYSFLISHLGI